ncbi:hypothetical protein Rsub_07272 [Raphidocelis subcapitata]|uniref:Uncharacterized protein n=1 Tax=Raphidocelis subcapitata TaxID=307507 RepID=A0A2V0P297_9CHLO|nr:hypothetical protein Rsub_07272 [Raphidocelis subcapitata]|eukprot:GBF94004.1 hypothetical protein Rsub_07272 [Raphidocelis subcapitata]
MRAPLRAALLILAGCALASAAPAPNATGNVGEPCKNGTACVTGICVRDECISPEAACALSAAAPASGCVGNMSAPFAAVQCGDATDRVVTALKLASSLGSTINSTKCYSSGPASCVVLRDGAALAHYGAQCVAVASGAAARGAATLGAALAAALLAAALA